MASSTSLTFFFALLAAAVATEVQQCPGRSFENLSENVEVTPCKKPPCRLKKGTDEHISITFTPSTEVKDVVNHVSAITFGLPLPFVGVDGNSICNKVFLENGEKASCPLQAGRRMQAVGVYNYISSWWSPGNPASG
ncbi:hypothetical protein evm_005293 [Chilo suppressalis]|nr:hypothetical protein evm_005293 [Chilo suppressalis]